MTRPSLPDNWQQHLAASGGRFDRQQWHFDSPSATDSWLAPLSHFAIIDIEGADTSKFLQGQTSAQLDLANGDIAPPTAFCTPKGRMIANAQIARIDTERYWLILDASVAERVRAHLAKYAVFYKTELALRDSLVIMGLTGSSAESLLSRAGLKVPQAEWHMCRVEDSVVLRHPHPEPRFMIIDTAERLIERWQTLSTLGAEPVSETGWQLRDIQAGLLWVSDATSESWLPQMLNWEALAGISFKKGCYTGQEVVARAHFRGQVKKRLMHLSLSGETLPEVGAAVVDNNDKRLGELVNVIATEQGGEALAVLNVRDEMPPMTIEGHEATLLTLPYALERRDPESLAG